MSQSNAARGAESFEQLFRRLPGRVRSRNRPRRRAGAGPPAQGNRADRLGKHRFARRAGGAGLGADQQICRGLSGQALLRRLPVRRYRRKSRHRARDQAVWLPLRQCAAQFRQPGQPVGVPGAVAARRRVHGPRSRRGRPSDPRLAGQHVRQMVQAGVLWRQRRDRPHRHGRGRGARQRPTSRS